MKLNKETETKPEEETPVVPQDKVVAQLMREGDSLTAKVSHSINVNGSDAWVGFEGTTNIGGEETADQARDRIIEFTQTAAMEAVKATVVSINNVQGGAA